MRGTLDYTLNALYLSYIPHHIINRVQKLRTGSEIKGDLFGIVNFVAGHLEWRMDRAVVVVVIIMK